MKLIEKEFINPLFAIAFKDGVDLAVDLLGDSNFKALEPKKEGQKWIVRIEDHTDDDDDDDDDDASQDEVVYSTPEKKKCKWCDELFTGPEGEEYCSTACTNEDYYYNAVTSESNKKETEPTVAKPMTTFKDWEDKFRSMKPVTPQSAPGQEIIHPPVKVSVGQATNMASFLEQPEIQPCGKCIPCKTGQDCIEVINAACLALPARER